MYVHVYMYVYIKVKVHVQFNESVEEQFMGRETFMNDET